MVLKNECDDSIAFMMSANKTKRQAQIDANQALVDASDGMMAKITGRENLLSAAGSHFSQFVKAAMDGCRTPIPELQDANGCLCVQHLSKDDEEFGTLCGAGWRWIVFTEMAEVAWPGLPPFVQYAHNAGNALYTVKGELECGMDICFMAKASGSSGPDYKAIVAEVQKSNPLCGEYLDTVAHMTRLFADGGATITLLDAFSKRWGDSKRLGEEFLGAVCDASFYGGAPYEQLRKAMIATNLVSNKVVDGIAKLLVKGDVARVAQLSKSISKPKEAEEAINASNTILADLIKQKAIDENKASDVGFRFSIRLVLHMVGKGKVSFDKRDFESFEAIKLEFARDLFKHRVTMSDAHRAQLGIAAPVAKTSPPRPVPLGTAEAIAQAHGGFSVGSLVVEKKGDPAMIFEIKTLGDEVEIQQVVYHELQQQLKATVELPHFIEQWKVKKCTKPEAFPASVDQRLPSKAFSVTKDIAVLFQSLVAFEENAEATYKDKLLFVHPRGIMSKVKLAAGDLTFAPVTTLTNVSKPCGSVAGKPTTGTVKATKTVLACSPPPYPDIKNATNPSLKDGLMFVPFWWVGAAHSQDTANMKVEQREDKHCSFSVLTNHKAIKPFEALRLYVEAKLEHKA